MKAVVQLYIRLEFVILVYSQSYSASPTYLRMI